jgi:hypothetical protein
MRLPLITILAAWLCTLAPAVASSVAVNFFHATFGPSTGINPGENTATLNSLTGLNNPVWTNLAINGPGGSPSGIGVFNGVAVSWHSSNAFQAGSEGVVTATNDASQQVFRMYLDDHDSGPTYFMGDGYGVSVQLSGLSALMAGQGATSYILTLFYGSDSPPMPGGMNIAEIRSGNLPLITTANAISNLPLLGTIGVTNIGSGTAPFTNPLPAGAQGNTQGGRWFGTLPGLTANSITIAIPANAGGGIRGSLAGFAITPVPEVSTPLLGLLGGVILALRRRRRGLRQNQPD